MAHTVKKPLAMQETSVQSLGLEDSPGEGNDNTLQYSCLENSRDRGALVGNKELDTTERLTLFYIKYVTLCVLF